MVPLLIAAALAAAPWPRVALTRVAAGFSSPTQVTSAHDGSGRLFGPRGKTFDPSSSTAS